MSELDHVEEHLWRYSAALFYVPVAAGSFGWWVYFMGPGLALQHVLGARAAEDALLGLAVGVGLAMASVALGQRFAPIAALEQSLAEALGAASAWTCLVLAVCSSVGEELFFRGVLTEFVGAPVATVLFALVHVPVDRRMAWWPLLALLAGAILAGLGGLTEALVAPVVAHFVVNLLGLLRLRHHPAARR